MATTTAEATVCICRKQSRKKVVQKKRDSLEVHEIICISTFILVWLAHPELTLFYFHFYSRIYREALSEKGNERWAFFCAVKIAFFCMMNSNGVWPKKQNNTHLERIEIVTWYDGAHEWHWHWHWRAYAVHLMEDTTTLHSLTHTHTFKLQEPFVRLSVRAPVWCYFLVASSFSPSFRLTLQHQQHQETNNFHYSGFSE